MDDMLTMHPGLPCRLASMPSSGRKACAMLTVSFKHSHASAVASGPRPGRTHVQARHERMQPAARFSFRWRQSRYVGRLTEDMQGKCNHHFRTCMAATWATSDLPSSRVRVWMARALRRHTHLRDSDLTNHVDLQLAPDVVQRCVRQRALAHMHACRHASPRLWA